MLFQFLIGYLSMPPFLGNFSLREKRAGLCNAADLSLRACPQTGVAIRALPEAQGIDGSGLIIYTRPPPF